MADETKESTAGSTETKSDDGLKNVKAEFNRKFDDMNKDLKKSNEALMAQLKDISTKYAAPAPAAQAAVSTDDDLMYSDPGAWAKKIRADAVKEANVSVDEKLKAQQDMQTQQQQTMNSLYVDYPELGSSEHDLTKRAIEIHNGMSDSDKQSSLAYKLAVKEAASELGMKPKSKRAEGEAQDTFTLKGASGMQSPSKQTRGKLDPKTIEFARIMGIDVDDPDVKANLESSTRDKWMKYKEMTPLKKVKRNQ